MKIRKNLKTILLTLFAICITFTLSEMITSVPVQAGPYAWVLTNTEKKPKPDDGGDHFSSVPSASDDFYSEETDNYSGPEHTWATLKGWFTKPEGIVSPGGKLHSTIKIMCLGYQDSDNYYANGQMGITIVTYENIDGTLVYQNWNNMDENVDFYKSTGITMYNSEFDKGVMEYTFESPEWMEGTPGEERYVVAGTSAADHWFTYTWMDTAEAFSLNEEFSVTPDQSALTGAVVDTLQSGEEMFRLPDGQYARNAWVKINGDYYFADPLGYSVQSIYSTDGYWVDADGKWDSRYPLRPTDPDPVNGGSYGDDFINIDIKLQNSGSASHYGTFTLSYDGLDYEEIYAFDPLGYGNYSLTLLPDDLLAGYFTVSDKQDVISASIWGSCNWYRLK